MKIRIAIFFSVLFLNILALPTIISVTNASEDIVLYLDFNEEEEENKGKEESKIDSELKIHSSTFNASFLSSYSSISKNIRFCAKQYVSKYPTIITPPPKVNT